MWQAVKAAVRAEHGRFDEQIRNWFMTYEEEGGRIHCRRGCSNCCSLMVNATFPEALVIAAALTDQQAAAVAGHAEKIVMEANKVENLREWLRTYRQNIGFCPLLEPDGACGVYGQRPFSCRALLATRNADWCGIDLSELHPLERRAFFSGLDPSAVAWPSHYAAVPLELGGRFENRLVRLMTDTFGFSLAGNLPLLIWLERNFRLSTVIPEGAESVSGLLARQEMSRHFLIDLRVRQAQLLSDGFIRPGFRL